MPQNIKFDDLLGKDFKEANYLVSTNWRIDFTKSTELRNIMGGNDNVLKQMSYACHSNLQFEASIEYAEAEIKGMHISQAAWQDRFIDDMTVEVYDTMDHRVFKALKTAAERTAGYFENRNINEKANYTFSGIVLEALGNSDGGNGEVSVEHSYELLGVQILSIESPEYTSENADIGSVTLHIKAHGWR